MNLPSPVSKPANDPANSTLVNLAFNNAAQANIISIVSSGKIVVANSAACKLLGYSKKEILTKSRKQIFDIKESGFKKMLKERSAEGHSVAIVIAIKKAGKHINCEITSSVFTDEDGIEKSITSIADNSQKIKEQVAIDAGKEKIVADNIKVAIATQKVIDTKKEKVVANDKEIVITKQKAIDKAKDKIVADNIKEVIATQKVIDIEKEKVVANDKVIVISKQKAIDKAKDKIIAADIITAQELADTKLLENSQWLKHVSKTSYDVMWDWDVLTGEVYIGDSVEEVFGCPLTTNHIQFDELKRNLFPHDDHTVEEKLRNELLSASESWNDSYFIKRFDGTVASVVSRATIVRDENGKAIRLIGATQDVTRMQELELEIKATYALLFEYNERFRILFNSSPDILFDIDLVKDEIILSDGYTREFGHPILPNMKPADVWNLYLHPDDKKRVHEDFHRMLRSKETSWKCNYRFRKADGSFANISSSRIIMRNSDGKAIRMIGSMQDVSQQKVLEERLEQEIKLKEKQIQDAMMDAKEAERSDIGKELHDNVNQLLSVSRLYLEMAKQGGPQSEMQLTRSSEYTKTAIEEIRKLTKGLSTDNVKYLGLRDSIVNLAEDTMQVKPVVIACNIDPFTEKGMSEKFKINVFRIVQEQLNNILKHAQARNIAIDLSNDEKTIRLEIADDGIGFDTLKKRKGIGVDNIKGRATAFNGVAEFVSSPGNGCTLTVNFAVATN